MCFRWHRAQNSTAFARSWPTGSAIRSRSIQPWKTTVGTLLLTAARVHGVGPRLASLLTGAPWVPAEVASWIEPRSTSTGKRLDLLRSEGAEILTTAGDRGDRRPSPQGPGSGGADSRTRRTPPHGGSRSAGPTGACRGPPRDSGRARLSADGQQGQARRVSAPLRSPGGVSRARTPRQPAAGGGPSALRRELRPHPIRPHRRNLVIGTPCNIGDIEVPVPDLEAIWTHLVLHAAWQWWFGGGRMVQLLDLVELLPLIHDPTEVVAEIDPRIALLALGTGRPTPAGSSPCGVDRRPRGPRRELRDPTCLRPRPGRVVSFDDTRTLPFAPHPAAPSRPSSCPRTRHGLRPRAGNRRDADQPRPGAARSGQDPRLPRPLALARHEHHRARVIQPRWKTRPSNTGRRECSRKRSSRPAAR